MAQASPLVCQFNIKGVMKSMVTAISMAMDQKVDADIEEDPVVFTKLAMHYTFYNWVYSTTMGMRDTSPEGGEGSSSTKLSTSVLNLVLMILICLVSTIK